MKIRNAKKKDFKELVDMSLDMFNLLRDFYDEGLHGVGSTRLKTKKKIKKYFNRYSIIEENNEIIGYIQSSINQQSSVVLDISAFYLKEEFRGKGIGHEIFSEFIEKNKIENNVSIVTLGVATENTIAKKLYSKMGFQQYYEDLILHL